jgi:hypothetical protein
MLPNKEQKLMQNTSFKPMKLKSDELTIGVGLQSKADEILLNFIREKAKTGSILNHQSRHLEANDIHVGALLSMFDDTINDDIITSENEQDSIIIDWDLSKPVIINKINSNNYLYMLSGATGEDFAKTEQDANGNWIEPTV